MTEGAKYEGPLFAREVERQQLRDRIVELERALTPFANFAAALDVDYAHEDQKLHYLRGVVLTVGHFQRAAEALKVRP